MVGSQPGEISSGPPVLVPLPDHCCWFGVSCCLLGAGTTCFINSSSAGLVTALQLDDNQVNGAWQGEIGGACYPVLGEEGGTTSAGNCFLLQLSHGRIIILVPTYLHGISSQQCVKYLPASSPLWPGASGQRTPISLIYACPFMLVQLSGRLSVALGGAVGPTLALGCSLMALNLQVRTECGGVVYLCGGKRGWIFMCGVIECVYVWSVLEPQSAFWFGPTPVLHTLRATF